MTKLATRRGTPSSTTRCGEGGERRLPHRAHEAPQGHPHGKQDGHEDQSDEQAQRQVQAAHQERVAPEEVNHRGPALEQRAVDRLPGGHVAHVVGHGPEHAQGREPHHHVRVLEHHLGHALEELEHDLPALAGAGEAHSEERGEDHHRQDVALGGVLDQVGGEQVQRHLPARGRLGQVLRLGHVLERQPIAGAQGVGHHQPDEQRQGGDHLEVEQRLPAHAADGLDVARLGDAHDDGGEQEGHDEPLD
jgi:hypothetical protein